MKLGLMTEDEATQRYMDLGYSPSDAVLMTEFAASLLDDYELEDEVDFRELTRTQVKTLFVQGTFSKSESIQKMVESGYSQDGATLLVGSWETALLIREREDLLNMVIAKAIREHKTIIQVERETYNLNLTQDERIRVDREVILRSKNFTSLPSKTELLKMYEAKIINGTEWFNTMTEHNYSPYWVTNYAKLMGVNLG